MSSGLFEPPPNDPTSPYCSPISVISILTQGFELSPPRNPLNIELFMYMTAPSWIISI